MRPQHRQVLDQILNSNSNSTLLSMRDNIAVQMRIVDQAHEINKLMGYGGLIHAFKNYLLRGEDHYYQLFHTHLETLQQYLNQLQQYSRVNRSAAGCRGSNQIYDQLVQAQSR